MILRQYPYVSVLLVLAALHILGVPDKDWQSPQLDINNLPHGVAAGNALYAGSRSNARLGLGDSGACAPALDTGDQCEMFVIDMCANAENSIRTAHSTGPRNGGRSW